MLCESHSIFDIPTHQNTIMSSYSLIIDRTRYLLGPIANRDNSIKMIYSQDINTNARFFHDKYSAIEAINWTKEEVIPTLISTCHQNRSY